MAGVENIFGRLYTQDSLIECIFLTAGNNGAPSKEEIKLLHKELNVLKGFVSQLPPEDSHSIVQWCNKLASFWNRFLSLKKTETACRVQHKLIVLEFAITNLFTIIPLPIELLKERLKDLEDLVAYIPVECANLAVTWRVKMSNFWLQFTSASSYTLRPIQAFPFDSFQYIPLHGNTHSIASSLVNMNFGQFGNPLMTSTMTLLDPLQQADNNGTIVNSMESDFISQESQSRSDMAESYENINSYQEHFSGENNEQSFDPSNDGDEMNNNGHELQEVDPIENVRQVIRNSFSLVEPLSSGSDVDGMKNILNTISTVGNLRIFCRSSVLLVTSTIFTVDAGRCDRCVGIFSSLLVGVEKVLSTAGAFSPSPRELVARLRVDAAADSEAAILLTPELLVGVCEHRLRSINCRLRVSTSSLGTVLMSDARYSDLPEVLWCRDSGEAAEDCPRLPPVSWRAPPPMFHFR
ncbi:hypothetical protein TYRP_001945 [Tyrophagus putrescentiae]|nr:hypothetical protein TYRP_001945 [Tyrophagus putrescentiae]